MKKKFTILMLLGMLHFSRAYAQVDVVCDETVYLTSQAEVDAFNCTEITGPLWITGADITDLSPLNGLRKVGMLTIMECNMLKNVNGLSGLRELTFTSGRPYVVQIYGNAVLENLDGLASLTSTEIAGISISDNPKLESVNAFYSVKNVPGFFHISNNASLMSMNGFKNMTAIAGYGALSGLLIDSNPKLTNVDAFVSLQSIEGFGANLEILNNTSLTNLQGFSSLKHVSGGGRGSGIFIKNNPALRQLDGLSSMVSIGYGLAGALEVSGNASLENLNGLRNIKLTQGNFFLTVINNPALKDCSGLYPVLVSYGLPYITNNFKISGNGSGCTLEDIIANGPPAVTGFSLSDKATGTFLYYLWDPTYFYMLDSDFTNHAVRAETNPQNVGSVEFVIDNRRSFVDNEYPFQLDVASLPPGTHTVVANIYSKSHKRGVKGISRSITINVINDAVVETFDVVDLSGKVLMTLKNGDVINIKEPRFKDINVRANVNTSLLNNVKFYLNQKLVRTETVAPYAVGGDTDGNFYSWKPGVGTYTMRAVPYMKPGAKEYAGTPLEVRFTIVSEPLYAVEQFLIVNTSGNVIRELKQGDQLDLDDPLLKAFTIIAITEGGPIGSVQFRLNNKATWTENVPPYTLTGDQSGYFNPWNPSVGNYILGAAPYDKTNSHGEQGGELKIRFSVIKSKSVHHARNGMQQDGDATISVYPIPTKNNLFVEAKNITGNLSLVLRNSQGYVVYNGNLSSQDQRHTINTTALPSGIYFLQLRGANGFEKVMRVVK